MPGPLRLAFLGCGFITRVHSKTLRSLKGEVVCAYASRDGAKAVAFCREFAGTRSYATYQAAIEGLKLVTPGSEHYVVPLTIVVLLGLFAAQSRGTARVASFFAPIMVIGARENPGWIPSLPLIR